MTEQKVVSTRLPVKKFREICELSAKQHRTVSQQIRRYIDEGMERDVEYERKEKALAS